MTTEREVAKLRSMLEDARLADVRISVHRYHNFSDAPSPTSAAEFGTQGVDIFAVKPQ